MLGEVRRASVLRSCVSIVIGTVLTLMIICALIFMIARSTNGVGVQWGAFCSIMVLFIMVGMTFHHYVGRRIVNWFCRMFRHFVHNDSKLHVFWTMTEQGLSLALDIARREPFPRIEFRFFKERGMDRFKRRRLIAMAEMVGATWRFLDFDALTDDAANGDAHYLLGVNGTFNLNLAQDLYSKLLANPCLQVGEKDFYVEVERVNDQRRAADWSQKVCGKGLVNPIIISESELIARQFITRHSPLKQKEIKIDYSSAQIMSGRCRTLLVGYDETGRRLLEYLLSASCFVSVRGLKTFPITVIDKDAERLSSIKGMISHVPIEADVVSCECLKLGTDEFRSWLVRHTDTFDRIIVNLPSDNETIMEGLNIRQIFLDCGRTMEIYVRVSDATSFVLATGDTSDLIAFGELKELYTIEFIRNASIEKMAKLVHATWSGIKWDAGSPLAVEGKDIANAWMSADMYSRQSSRASAVGVLNMLFLLGYEPLGANDKRRPCDLVCSVNSEWAVHNQLSEAVVETLARNEHFRWCLFMFWDGFVSWDLKTPISILDNHVEKKAKQLSGTHKLHAALIDYDRLPWLDAELCKSSGLKSQDGEELTPEVFQGKESVSLRNDSGVSVQYTTMQGKDIRNVRDIYGKIIISGMNLVKLRKISSEDVGTQCNLARHVYDKSRAKLLKGFHPFDSFLLAKNIREVESQGGSDRKRFSFRNLEGKFGCVEYDYNETTGVIIPSRGCWGQPAFVAQVLEKDDAIYLAFGGTACWRDWIEDIQQYFGSIPAQYFMASELFQAIGEKCGCEMNLVGHSEGGGEVQYALLSNPELLQRSHGWTFNSQRLSQKVIQVFSDNTIGCVKGVVNNFRIPWDPVSGLTSLGVSLLGPVYDFQCDWKPVNVLGRLLAIAAHPVKSFDRYIDGFRT